MASYEGEDDQVWEEIETMFPSWVPHWNRERHAPLCPGFSQQYKASKDYPIRLRTCDDAYSITLQGIKQDCVVWVGEPIYKFSPDIGEPMKIHAILYNLCEAHEKLDEYPTGETFDDVFAITAAAGAMQEKNTDPLCTPGTDMSFYCADLLTKCGSRFSDRLPNFASNRGVGWNKHHETWVRDICLYRCFFITEKGYLGLGSGKILVGDLICVLFSGNAAYVLREMYDHHKLVGECYVHGIMKGEVIEEWESGNLKEHWFKIR
jgi:hypothetical protein